MLDDKIFMNGSSWLLQLLGFHVPWNMGGIFGNVVLFGGETANGNKKNIPIKYIKLIKLIEEEKKSNPDDLDELISKVQQFLAKNKPTQTKNRKRKTDDNSSSSSSTSASKNTTQKKNEKNNKKTIKNKKKTPFYSNFLFTRNDFYEILLESRQYHQVF